MQLNRCYAFMIAWEWKGIIVRPVLVDGFSLVEGSGQAPFKLKAPIPYNPRHALATSLKLFAVAKSEAPAEADSPRAMINHSVLLTGLAALALGQQGAQATCMDCAPSEENVLLQRSHASEDGAAVGTAAWRWQHTYPK